LGGDIDRSHWAKAHFYSQPLYAALKGRSSTGRTSTREQPRVRVSEKELKEERGSN